MLQSPPKIPRRAFETTVKELSKKLRGLPGQWEGIVKQSFGCLSRRILQLLDQSKGVPSLVIPADIESALKCDDINYSVKFLHASIQLVESRVRSVICSSGAATSINLDVPLATTLHELLVDISEFANLLQHGNGECFCIEDKHLGVQLQNGITTNLDYLHQYASLYALFVLVMGHIKISAQDAILGGCFQVFIKAMPCFTWQQCLKFHAIASFDLTGLMQLAELGGIVSVSADLPLPLNTGGANADLPSLLFAPDRCREFAQMLCYLGIHNAHTQSCTLIVLELLESSEHQRKCLLLADGYDETVHMPILQAHMQAYEAWCSLKMVCEPEQDDEPAMCAVAEMLKDLVPICDGIKLMHSKNQLVAGSPLAISSIQFMEALIQNITTYYRHMGQDNPFRVGLMLRQESVANEAEQAWQVSLQPLKDLLAILKTESRQQAVCASARLRSSSSLAGVEEEGDEDVHTPASPEVDDNAAGL